MLNPRFESVEQPLEAALEALLVARRMADAGKAGSGVEDVLARGVPGGVELFEGAGDDRPRQLFDVS